MNVDNLAQTLPNTYEKLLDILVDLGAFDEPTGVSEIIFGDNKLTVHKFEDESYPVQVWLDTAEKKVFLMKLLPAGNSYKVSDTDPFWINWVVNTING